MKDLFEPLLVIAALLVVGYGLASLFGCAPMQAPTSLDATVSDAAPLDGGDEYDTACANIATVGCYEGRSPYCATSMRDSASALGITFDVACLGAARSKADVRACAPSGGVGCP